jgi:asparagine synthase (glutamine-hydrolysing)
MNRASSGQAGRQYYDAAIQFATDHLGLETSETLRGPGGTIGVFGRRVDSQAFVAKDSSSGSWLFSVGTWLHCDDTIGNDAELLARYLDIGPIRLAGELEGFFVVVTGDRHNRNIVVITDLIGSCRAYARDLPDGLLISGSSLVLAAVAPYKLDPVGVQEFVGSGIVYEDRTVFADIRKLKAATIYQLRTDHGVQPTRYWALGDLKPESLAGESAVENFIDVLVDAAKRVGRRFAHPVCDLTGGYDSRGLVAALLAAGARFTTTVAGPEESADVRISSAIAEIAGIEHLHLSATAAVSTDEVEDAHRLTHGEYDDLDYARILKIHTILSRRFPISLNGSFGELARGYWWDLRLLGGFADGEVDYASIATKRFAAGFDNAIFSSHVRFAPVQHFLEATQRTNSTLKDAPRAFQMDNLYLMMRMQSWQGAIATSTNRLWPCLSPFMLRPVLEAMLQTSSRLRRRSLLMRKAIARMAPRLGEYPLEHGHPAMPAGLLNGYKFFPLAVHYGRKAASRATRKIGRTLGFRFAPAVPPTWLVPHFDARAVSILRSLSPQINELLEPAALEAVMSDLSSPVVRAQALWSRLLTLELSLRSLQRARLRVDKVQRSIRIDP